MNIVIQFFWERRLTTVIFKNRSCSFPKKINENKVLGYSTEFCLKEIAQYLYLG